MKKVLLVTFSDNADHQDTLFGMYEEMQKRSDWDTYLLCAIIVSRHTKDVISLLGSSCRT